MQRKINEGSNLLNMIVKISGNSFPIFFRMNEKPRFFSAINYSLILGRSKTFRPA